MKRFTLIGKKIGMTQWYDAKNRLIPITVIEVGPCPVVQIKTREKDGYDAVQIGFSLQKASRVSQPQLGHFSKAGVEPTRELHEFRIEAGEFDLNLGDVLDVSRFEVDQKVDVIGTTIGRGFQGVVKRFDFKGGPASHGSMAHRRGGSYGQCQWPGEVAKGKKMPGHEGNRRRTTQNLMIVKVIAEKNLLLLKGSLAGPENSTLYIRTAKKTRRPR